jgi:hypothetical protein
MIFRSDVNIENAHGECIDRIKQFRTTRTNSTPKDQLNLAKEASVEMENLISSNPEI